MNLHDILSLKFPKADFMKDIQLADEGRGVFIREWNIPDIEEPSDAVLVQWAIEVDFAYRTRCVLEQRIYPSIQDQLDMLYHDRVEGTETWKGAIKAIKDKYPKPIA